jgi:hypothetical protein
VTTLAELTNPRPIGGPFDNKIKDLWQRQLAERLSIDLDKMENYAPTTVWRFTITDPRLRPAYPARPWAKVREEHGIVIEILRWPLYTEELEAALREVNLRKLARAVMLIGPQWGYLQWGYLQGGKKTIESRAVTRAVAASLLDRAPLKITGKMSAIHKKLAKKAAKS